MRSFGKALAVAFVAAALAPVLLAQTSQPERLYNEAVAREGLLRREMEAYRANTSPESLLRRIRVLSTSYADMARLFPASGYSDNALFQGAVLSADAFWQFGEAEDRSRALELFGAVTARFPSSSLLKQVPAHVKRLTDARAGTAPSVVPAAITPAARPAAKLPLPPAPPARLLAPAVLKAIRREVLPDALRITLELEREVSFHAERLDAPPRVFVDLENAAAAQSLIDSPIPFSADIVNQIRVGRQPDSRIRVVVDLNGTGRYSVYALYNPYRVVIDFERPGSSAPGAATPPAARTAPASERVEPASRTAPAAPPAAAAANAAGGFSLSRQLGLGIARIVIDPGHGGQDPGARVRGLTEAGVVLDIALRLEKLLQDQPGVDVVLTRRSDEYVPLEERTALANRAEADLFLSIHANASRNTNALGVETYFLNFAPTPEAEAIAARENADSARTMRQLPDIVRAITLNNKIDESRDFASMVQTSLYDRLRKVNRNLKNLGVKQAPFMVLIGATMPSVLAEIAFLTNRQEADLLKTDKYRQQIAEALLAGVMRYQQSLKKGPVVARN
jgi:N-acetylmuramoyl-L-alanine amidase